MTGKAKLIIVKWVHTLIWVFFNVIIAYLLYSTYNDRIDKWTWIGLGFILLEAIVLIIFKRACPVTLVARRYSDSTKDNFDIFLPNWLAKYNKLIYSIIMVFIIALLIYRLLT